MVSEQEFSDAMSDLDKAETEIERLRQALLLVQCEQLDRATNDELSAKRHRQLAMATRDRIITILAPQQQPDK